jgi:hypothetical protein
MAQTSTKRQLTDEGKMPAKGSLWVNNKYTLIHQLYEGVSSKIFVGAFMKNNRQVTRAIKVVLSFLFSNPFSTAITGINFQTKM